MQSQDEVDLIDRAQVRHDNAFLIDVLAGLSQVQKSIPARWFYDLAGSGLFEQITRLPDYYPTKAEIELLKEHGPDIAGIVGAGLAVVEFGSGSSTKTPLLLERIAPAAYVPIDISGDFLRQASLRLQERFPALKIIPVEADFTRPVALPSPLRHCNKLAFFPGSTIGNLSPFAAVDLLRSMADTLGEDSWLLIGMDRVKDRARLLKAYDDPEGLTAQFNLNLLRRINRELDADISVERFTHVVRWDAAALRIEMHLRAEADMDFRVDGQRFFMRLGETIHTENSHKYTPASASLLLQAGGWSPSGTWTGQAGDFLLILARRTDIRPTP